MLWLSSEREDLPRADDRELDPSEADVLDRSGPDEPLAAWWVVSELGSLAVVRCFGVVGLVIGLVAEYDIAPAAAWPVETPCDPALPDRVPCAAEPVDAE